MNSLVNIYRLLSGNTNNAITLSNLLQQCLTIISNPHFRNMISLEYSLADLDSDEFLRYLSRFPFIHFIFKIHSIVQDTFYKGITLLPMDSFRTDVLRTISTMDINFSESTLTDFLKKSAQLYLENSKKYEQLSDFMPSFFINNKQHILSLSKYLFQEALSFEIKDIFPLINYNDSQNIYNWNFNSLISAIFFSFYFNCSGAHIVKQCANPHCKKLFLCPSARRVKIYCSPACKSSVNSARTRNRKKTSPQKS